MRLANELAATERIVVKWGDKIGRNGNDVITINLKTGFVELWGSKFRSNIISGKISPTFNNQNTLVNAIKEAQDAILRNNKIPIDIKKTSIDNLKRGNVITYTVGDGKVKSSIIQKICSLEKG